MKIELDDKKAKDLHFVLKHDLISGVLPIDMVKSIEEIKKDLEKSMDEEELR